MTAPVATPAEESFDEAVQAVDDRDTPHKSASLIIGLVILGAIVFGAIFVGWFRPYGPNEVGMVPLQGPGGGHWLGTDELDRDLFVRVMVGARSTLLVALFATLFATVVGVSLGLISTYYSGWTDRLISNGLELMFAIPPIIVAFALIVVLGANSITLVVGLGIVFSPYVARVVRGVSLSIVSRGFVDAARVSGVPSLTIIRRHVLPHIRSIVAIQMASTASITVLLEATLSYLGLGVQPPTPSWGLMLLNGQKYMEQAPMYVLAPGAAIVLTTISFNLIADGLQDRTANRT